MSTSEKERHDRIVSIIAKQRFPYPDSSQPNWKVFLNEPTQTMGVKTANDAVYPDIVVVSQLNQQNQLQLIGEIETELTINQDMAIQWKTYSSLCQAFYLYVPSSKLNDTLALLKSQSITLGGGLRTYSIDGNGNLIIQNI